jgi:hypothetical protein
LFREDQNATEEYYCFGLLMDVLSLPFHQSMLLFVVVFSSSLLMLSENKISEEIKEIKELEIQLTFTRISKDLLNSAFYNKNGTLLVYPRDSLVEKLTLIPSIPR